MQYALGYIILAVVLAIVSPLLTIWALNTLFPVLNIGYTLESWAAVIVLGALITVKVKKD